MTLHQARQYSIIYISRRKPERKSIFKLNSGNILVINTIPWTSGGTDWYIPDSFENCFRNLAFKLGH